jgi:hypothetical protein
MSINDITSESLIRHQRICRMCKAPVVGRSDKIFCSASCKARYHIRLNKVTDEAAAKIDKILHRNRSILLEILGKNKYYKKVHRSVLDAKKFNWQYITHNHINTQNKFIHYIYDFSWMIFSDQEVVIQRNQSQSHKKVT